MVDEDSEYLTFILGSEEFGVDILCVQEIRVWSGVTEIPNSPTFFKGIVNLRGVIVPIIDLRDRFNKTITDYNSSTVVIILKSKKQDIQITMGIVVDAVSDVYKIRQRDIRDAPNLGKNIDSKFIRSIGTIDNKMLILLDTDVLMDIDEVLGINEAYQKISVNN